MLSSLAASLFAEPEFKMVFVVNKELDMGVGKQCAQVAHAAIGLYNDILTNDRTGGDNQVKIMQWQSGGAKKIVCRGNNTAHLVSLQEQANMAQLPNHLVTDAGHTQIPAGSTTVLAIFGSSSQLDKVTGSLRLL
uniref:peptidyl-tRNA hydrolase n=1 Tax=Aceria tosichella TaxID=561515 RepID=A0A6G1SMK2_9ACAR